MEEYRKDYPVSVLCDMLGVSLSGGSAWKKRSLSQHQREDHQLAEHIHTSITPVGRCMGVHVFMLNCGIRASPSPANGWLASCENRHCLLVVVVIGRSRPAVSLARVFFQSVGSRLYRDPSIGRNGRVISQDRDVTSGGSTWQWCWISPRVG